MIRFEFLLYDKDEEYRCWITDNGFIALNIQLYDGGSVITITDNGFTDMLRKHDLLPKRIKTVDNKEVC